MKSSEHNNYSKMYFEAHVTIEPIYDTRLEQASIIAANHNFKVASLLMKKRAEDVATRSMYDTFMTAHGKDLIKIKTDIIRLVTELKDEGFKVHRYKIEDIVLDSRYDDELHLLG